MQTCFPHLLGFWDVITSSLLGLFPTVNKALKQPSSFLCESLHSFHCHPGFSLLVLPQACD